MPEGAGATFMVLRPGGGIGAGGRLTGAVGDFAEAGGSGAAGMATCAVVLTVGTGAVASRG